MKSRYRRRFDALRLLGYALVCTLLLPRAASARPRPHVGARDQAAVEQSAQLCEQARTALSAHDLPGAYRLAAQAFRVALLPDALYLLGRVALTEKRLLDAQDLMRRYLVDPDLEISTESEDQKQAQRLLDQARPASAQLTILGDRGTLIFVDERLVGALPLVRPLLVTPGEHKVVLERRGAHLEDQVRVPVGRLGELRCNFATKALALTVLPGVLLLDESLGLAPAEQTKLDGVVENAVLGQRLSPIDRVNAQECSGEPAPGTCPDAVRCQVAQAQRCEADYILRTRLVRDPKNPVQLRIDSELIDVTMGDVAATDQRDCAGCTIEQLVAGLNDRLGPLLTRATNRPRGRLEISSVPLGAAISIDGRSVGVTPYQTAVWAGEHRVSLKKDGYAEEVQSVEVSDGGTGQVTANLVVTSSAEKSAQSAAMSRPGRPLWRLISGGVAIGAGVVLMSFGVSALAVNNSCIGDTFNRTSACQTLYDTTPTGGALLGVGGALLIGGAVLCAWPPAARKSAAAKGRASESSGLPPSGP